MFCSDCGKPVDNEANFCGECGALQSATPMPINTHLQKNIPQLEKNGTSYSVKLEANPPVQKYLAWIIAAAVLVFLFVLLGGLAPSEERKMEDAFKNTNAGKALFSCISNGGNLKVHAFKLANGSIVTEAKLEKDKTINLQFAVDKNLNQAKFTGGEIVGDTSKLTKFLLMLTLENMCGGAVPQQIFSDEYNALQMLNNFR